ncbi:MAG: PucR family transcriptional regulator, purine catabolism regulatory protein [Mycobacterium sp.]|nr:PucR family transcriptional regulator, purine catabolism regulatory protein [Mycobacterium sp.]
MPPMTSIVREVLTHPVLQPAEPVVLSGHAHLDHVVRWVHTADLYDIAPLLRGDEILLTNGVGLVRVDQAARRLYVRQLAESGVAALFFEVGRSFGAVPPEMVAEACDVGLPVVGLRPRLRFTEVAEAINSELIDRSVARLRHADETSRVLSEALARGATLNELMEQVAATLGTWARLTDYAGRAVALAGCSEDGPGASSEVPVLVDGTAWGRLAVGSSGSPALLVDAVLDRAPTVLGLCLIREQRDVAGSLRAQHILLEQLVANQSVDAFILEARLRAAGIAAVDAQYVCVAVDPHRVTSAAQVVDALVRHTGHGIFGLVDGTLFGLLASPAGGPSDLAGSVAGAAAAALGSHSRLCAAVSRVVYDVSQLPRAMADTRVTLALGQDLHMKDAVTGVQTLALERLLAAHGDRDAVRQFVDDQIGILLAADAAKGSQLLVTLETFVACGGSKAEAAKRLHIRRQSLYYRLEQISKMTAVNLEDPHQLMTLAVATAARGLAARVGR